MKHLSRATRLSLAATTVLAAVLSSGGVAGATVSPDDEATGVLRVTQRDGAGGVHVVREARGALSKAALKAVDVARVAYRIDRVEGTLTVTITTRHRVVTAGHYRQYFATVLLSNPSRQDGTGLAFLSRPGTAGLTQVDVSDGSSFRCDGGTSTMSGHGRVQTQTVPFACLEGVEHGRLYSGTGLETRRDGDVAWDLTRRTRDLPFTVYEAPPTP